MDNIVQTIPSDVFDDEESCLSCFKKHSGKFSISVSVLGGIGAILMSHYILASAVVIGITNIGVFFSGLCYEQLKNKNDNMKKEFMTLKQEKIKIENRLSTYHFPDNETENDN